MFHNNKIKWAFKKSKKKKKKFISLSIKTVLEERLKNVNPSKAQ